MTMKRGKRRDKHRPPPHKIQRFHELVASLIKTHRDKHGLTVGQFAFNAALSAEDIESIEHLKFRLTLLHVVAIADVLGMTGRQLLRKGGM